QCLRAVTFAKILDLLPLPIKDRAARPVAREVAPLAVDQDPLVLSAKLSHRRRALVGAHVADLADERSRQVIKERDAGVCRLAAVVESEPAADAHGARRRRILSQCPPAYVDDVNAIVPHLTVARVPEPVPLIMQLLAHERSLLGWATP